MDASQLPNQIQVPEKSFSKLLRQPKILALMGVGVLVILVLIVMFVVSRVSAPKPTADPVVATVGDQQISKSEIESLALTQYDQKAVDQKVKEMFFETLVERKILDIEAEKNNILILDEEAKQKVADSLSTPSAQVPENLVVQTKYNMIKEKLMSKFVDSVTAYTISYWTPPPDYPQGEITDQQRAEHVKQREQGVKALEEMRGLMLAGVDSYSSLKQIIYKDEYKELRRIIAFNGYIFEKTFDESILGNPRVYTPADREAFGDQFFDSMFYANAGDIKIVFSAQNSTGLLTQVLQRTNATYKNYSDWLKDKKAEYLRVHSSL